MTKPLPAVVDVVPFIPHDTDQRPCLCLCFARHPNSPGVCQGIIEVGARVHFASLYSPTNGVEVCAPCIAAYPEVTV